MFRPERELRCDAMFSRVRFPFVVCGLSGVQFRTCMVIEKDEDMPLVPEEPTTTTPAPRTRRQAAKQVVESAESGVAPEGQRELVADAGVVEEFELLHLHVAVL